MKNPLRTGLIALVASAVLVSSKPAESQQPAVQPDPVVEAGQFNVTVNFEGGTLQDYIQTLQKAAGKMPVNVVAPAEARKVELPAITLRNVNLFTALSAISSAFEFNSEHQFGVGTIGNPADATYAITYSNSERGSLMRDPTGRWIQRAPTSPPPRQVQTTRLEVYSIRDLISSPAEEAGDGAGLRVKFEDILSAIEGAMQLLDTEDKPRLLFHKETGLLMVGGTEYQTQVVSALLAQIRDDLAQRRVQDQNQKQHNAAIERSVRIARTEVRLPEMEMVQARDRLARVGQMVEQGAESSDALGKATLELERAKARLEREQIELQEREEGLPKRPATSEK